MRISDPTSPHAWGEAFGLVAVPMFSPERAAGVRGTHAVMLDGSRASFALSIIRSRESESLEQYLQRAWSANVRHAVVVEEDTGGAFSFAWDSPTKVAKWDLSRSRAESSLIASFTRDRSEPRESVIERALRTFDRVRVEVEALGGDELDSVRVFNEVLSDLAKRMRRRADLGITSVPQEMVDELSFEVKRSRRHQRSVRPPYPVRELELHLLSGGDKPGLYLVDADLLVRHAGGTLYQEAHRRVVGGRVSDSQYDLFEEGLLVPQPAYRRGSPPKTVHHTPPSLARMLVTCAFDLLENRKRSNWLRILDPACGSGVFLIEAQRENERLGGVALPLRLEGFEISPIAAEMAKFCTGLALDPNAPQSVAITQRDSLASSDWGSPDVILMNPPFVAWEHLTSKRRAEVATELGDAMSGRPDLSTAFLSKAIRSVKDGGVVACLLPASFLDGDSSQQLRKRIAQSDDLQVRLLGHFKGRIFPSAIVEPAFIVVQKSRVPKPVRVVTAERGNEDRAIRAFRSARAGHAVRGNGFEVYDANPETLLADSWVPRQRRVAIAHTTAVKRIDTTVADFFNVRLGVRTGRKGVFVIDERTLNEVAETSFERAFFRPTADLIVSGRIIRSTFVFYPYTTEGVLRLSSEAEVKAALPEYYDLVLLPQRDALENRKSGRGNWWEPSEPVKSWLAPATHRIVSQAFGRRGDFAVDITGQYGVVQGHAWVPTRETTDDDLLAILPLINSAQFETLLQYECPTVQGGQFDLSGRFVLKVPLPWPERRSIRRELIRLGRQIAFGYGIDWSAVDYVANDVFQIPIPTERASEADDSLEMRFQELARKWRNTTAAHSFESRKVASPIYEQIVAMGPAVVPLLLRDLRAKPDYWHSALARITGEDPVPDDASSLGDVANAWIQWGNRLGL